MGIPTKHETILVVTITGKGDNPTYSPKVADLTLWFTVWLFENNNNFKTHQIPRQTPSPSAWSFNIPQKKSPPQKHQKQPEFQRVEGWNY